VLSSVGSRYFQQNYNKVLELALRLVNKYVVVDILLPALAEKLAYGEMALSSIREITGVSMRSLYAVRRRDVIEGHFKHFIGRIWDYVEERKSVEPDLVSPVNSLLRAVGAFGGETLKTFIADKAHILPQTTESAIVAITLDLSTFIERVIACLKAGNLDLEAFPKLRSVKDVNQTSIQTILVNTASECLIEINKMKS